MLPVQGQKINNGKASFDNITSGMFFTHLAKLTLLRTKGKGSLSKT
jgi:hypothetical protein